METDPDRPYRPTYVEPAPAAGDGPEAVYRARHARLHAAGKFERLVREGGMGAVLEVRGEVLDLGRGRFAVKLIKEALLGEPEVAARFRRELASHRRLSASFQVPRLVPCLAVADDEDAARVFGVFPFYPDGSLEDALGRGLAVAEALWILADAAEGLQSLHGLGYVHRDFHPSNVLIDREGGRRRGVLGDLGVGVFLQSNSIFTDTQLGADRRRQVGHRGYIDPLHRASPQADLYAVGATLYRILTGRAPTGCGFPEAGALTLPAGSSCPAPVRRAAAALLARSTSPREGDRYPSVREARVDLVALAELVEGLPEPAAASRSPTRPSRRRGGRRLVRLAVLTVLAVSSSAYGVWSWRPEPLAADSPARTGDAGVAPTMDGIADGRTLAPATEVLRLGPLLRDRRLRQAESLARDLWARYPADPEIAGRLAAIVQLAGGGDGTDEARTILETALDRHPGRGDLRLALARLLLQLEPPAAAAGLLADAPGDGTHGDEIEALLVTIGRSGDRSE